jgi:hypothetical protein
MKASVIVIALAAAAMTTGFTGCRSQQETSSTYSTFQLETTSLGITNSGVHTLRAWGKGATKAKAIEQAKKNAVYDIIFKGISGGNSSDYKAIVTEVNARERYQEYFDRFFADGGEYQNFVTESSNNDNSRVNSKGDSRVCYGVVVDVDRSALRRQLLNDGILAH